MEYYIISFFISIVIFVFVYLYDYKSVNNNNYNGYDNNNYDVNGNEDKKPLFSTNNILLFVIIYIVSTIISFYSFTSSISLSGLYNLCPIFLINLFKPPVQAPPLIKDNGDGDEIDPKILSKITDTIDIGFTPPIIEDNNENK
jgi:magnesium-transporting ATPase (P-type)